MSEQFEIAAQFVKMLWFIWGSALLFLAPAIIVFKTIKSR